MRDLRKFLAALVLALFAAVPAQADIFRSAEFSLVRGEEAGSYEFTARLPQSADSGQAITWPQGCTQSLAARSSAGSLVLYSFKVKCAGEIGAGDTIVAPWLVDGATFTSNLAGTAVRQTLPAAETGILLPIGGDIAPARAFDEVALDYGWQGIIHIWMGWDHLAFVLCLCLIARGRELIGLVTAFTIGHSISLALAFFELVTVPMMPVEAVIALSIAFMAREALIAKDMVAGPARMKRYVTVVSVFGLLHGLGFASALEELGVVAGERVTGLVFFNVGVETGQLLFVGAVTSILWLLRRLDTLQPVRLAALYGVGVLGAFWMVERIAGFTGFA